MKTSYVPIARDYDGWNTDERTTVTVFEPDDKPVASGLYDANGVMLYRVTKREPIGFVVKP